MVLTEIAAGQVKCFCHGRMRGWKRFCGDCCQGLFDKNFSTMQCMWHLIRRVLDRDQYQTLLAYQPIGNGDVESIMLGVASDLRMHLNGTATWQHFAPRNVVKYESEKEFMEACPPIPKDLLLVSEANRNRLLALHGKLTHTRLREIKKGKMMAIRFETDKDYIPINSRKVTMSSFVEYLRYVTHKKGIMRVVDVDNKSNPIKIETENRSGPNLKVALTTIGSYELV